MYTNNNAFQRERPPVYPIGTRHPSPVNAVAASAEILCNATDPSNLDTMVVGGITYTFKTTPVANYDIKISATPGTMAQTIADAINMADAPGAGNNVATTGTYVVPAANPFCTAIVDTATVYLTAAVKGAAGNVAFPTVSNSTSFTVVDFETADTGIDGTIGHKNEIRYENDNIYRCSDGNTISGANWIRGTIGS